MRTYTFFFDPAQTTWAHEYQFEQSFAKYLESIGLEAQNVDAGSEKVYYISKKAGFELPKTMAKSLPQHSLTQQLANLKKGFKK